MVNLHQNINISQKLQMQLAPKMIEMLKLLNLPFHALMEQIDKEAEENPVLEVEKPEVLFEYLRYLNSDKKVKKEIDYSEYDGLKNVAAVSKSLHAHLSDQLKLTELEGDDFDIAEMLIESIDQRGYISNFDEVVKKLKISLEYGEKILKIIQTFEPDGVGARDLKESLLIQIREYTFDDPEIEDILTQVVKYYLEDLGEHKYKEIADKEGVLEQDIIDVANFIKENLSPFPAADFSESERMVVPSYAIEVKEEEIVLTNLEERYGPKIRVSSQYERMLKDPKTDQNTVKFLKERIEKIKEMIDNLSKRQETGDGILGLIVERQDQFFKKGAAHFRPLLQKEIADKLGLHPSTISRAIAQKYVQTPRGMMPLKYLCPRDISGFSSFEIKNKVKEIVESEDKSKPYSDTAILDILKESGIRVSRRTVSTFRNDLGFKSFKERKE